jgi:hypothetical protein
MYPGGVEVTQFEDFSDEERTLLRTSLLRYCELDILAMIIILKSWMAL